MICIFFIITRFSVGVKVRGWMTGSVCGGLCVCGSGCAGVFGFPGAGLRFLAV